MKLFIIVTYYPFNVCNNLDIGNIFILYQEGFINLKNCSRWLIFSVVYFSLFYVYYFFPSAYTWFNLLLFKIIQVDTQIIDSKTIGI